MAVPLLPSTPYLCEFFSSPHFPYLQNEKSLINQKWEILSSSVGIVSSAKLSLPLACPCHLAHLCTTYHTEDAQRWEQEQKGATEKRVNLRHCVCSNGSWWVSMGGAPLYSPLSVIGGSRTVEFCVTPSMPFFTWVIPCDYLQAGWLCKRFEDSLGMNWWLWPDYNSFSFEKRRINKQERFVSWVKLWLDECALTPRPSKQLMGAINLGVKLV